VADIARAIHVFAECELDAVVATVARITGDTSGAEDAVQDAIVHMLENPPVVPIDNIAAWITVVAANRCRDRIRRRGAEVRALDRIGVVRREGSSDTILEPSLRDAIAALPAQQRHICVLYYVIDESVDMIATRLGITPGSVKTQLFRARRSLATRLMLDVAA
jgi:RNA polymerase sigma-70 factor, ECF subfamily